MNTANPSPPSFFAKPPWLYRGVLILIFLLGLGIRLYDLTDPPLDFHSTRQLWSAIIARGMYYQGLDSAPAWQKELAVEAWKEKPVIEPPLFETLVALTYRLAGGEYLWIPRVYSALFWLIGGLGLFLLARKMTSAEGALVALVYYLFLPFGAIASRSFQPDPLMVMGITLAWWSFFRWQRSPTWKRAIVAGVITGLAILVKFVAVFMLLGGMAALVLRDRGFKAALKDKQVWAVVVLSALPAALYLAYGLFASGMASQFEGRFFFELLKKPNHYVRWGSVMMSVVGFSGIMLGLVGTLMFQNPSQRAFVIGLWGGYVVYGLFFPYHFLTHDYYHLPLIPLVALCLAPVADGVFRQLAAVNPGKLARLAVLAILFLGIALKMWDIRVELARSDFRHEPPYWQALGELIGREHTVVALTQDYGYRLTYYGWINVRNWPETRHLKYRQLRGGKPLEFESWFAEETEGMDYFLVTRLKELERQKELRQQLYGHYPLVAEGDGYLLFDLRASLP